MTNNLSSLVLGVAAAFLCAGVQPVLAQERGRTRPRVEEDGSPATAQKAIPREHAPRPEAREPDAAPKESPQTTRHRRPSEETQRDDQAVAPLSSTAAAQPPGPQSQAETATERGSRPRESRVPTGTAVGRPNIALQPVVVTEIVPWVNVWSVPTYYHSYGPGYFYWDPFWGTMFQPWYQTGYVPAGALRIKVKPLDAQVFVDGYYEGTVDDFDGVFQRLHLTPGPHSVSIRAPGYESLDFQIQTRLADTVTYRGQLRPAP